MISYRCDICNRDVKGKRDGFVLTIEPLIEPANGAMTSQEDVLRIRQLAKSVLVCSYCYKNLYSVMTKEPEHSHLIISIGDKQNAIIVDNQNRVVTPEMRIDLDPGIVHKTIIKYFTEINKVRGGSNGQETKSGLSAS